MIYRVKQDFKDTQGQPSLHAPPLCKLADPHSQEGTSRGVLTCHLLMRRRRENKRNGEKPSSVSYGPSVAASAHRVLSTFRASAIYRAHPREKVR